MICHGAPWWITYQRNGVPPLGLHTKHHDEVDRKLNTGFVPYALGHISFLNILTASVSEVHIVLLCNMILISRKVSECFVDIEEREVHYHCRNTRECMYPSKVCPPISFVSGKIYTQVNISAVHKSHAMFQHTMSGWSSGNQYQCSFVILSPYLPHHSFLLPHFGKMKQESVFIY